MKPLRGLLRYVDRARPWHFTIEEIRKMSSEANFVETYTNINVFHWKARNIMKHLIAKTVIRNYFVIAVIATKYEAEDNL